MSQRSLLLKRSGITQLVRTLSTTPSSALLDLSEVHRQWKGAGHNPRAPAHVSYHGSKCLNSQLHKSCITKHVFRDHHTRLFPVHAQIGTGSKEIDFGTLVTPTEAVNQPTVDMQQHPVRTDKKYSLLITSPDCPNCSISWFQTNTQTDKPTTLLSYIPPVPLKGSGFYRYILVLLEHDQDITQTPSRSNSLSDIMSREEGVESVGASYFQAAWDGSVGGYLAKYLEVDEKQYAVERPKKIKEHYAEEMFLRKEWELKTGFM